MNTCETIGNYIDEATSETGVVYWETLVSDLTKEKPNKLIDILSSLSFSDLERLTSSAEIALIKVRESELELIKTRLHSLHEHKNLTLDERAELFAPLISGMHEDQARALITKEAELQPGIPAVTSTAISSKRPEIDDEKLKLRCDQISRQYPRGTLADPTVKTSARVILSRSMNASKDKKLSRIYLNYLISTDDSLDIATAGDKFLTYFKEYRVQAFYAVKSDIKNGKIAPVLECPLSTSFKAAHVYLVDKKQGKPVPGKKKIVSGLSALADLDVDTISEKKAELNRQLREEDFVDEELLAELDCQSKYIK